LIHHFVTGIVFLLFYLLIMRASIGF